MELGLRFGFGLGSAPSTMGATKSRFFLAALGLMHRMKCGCVWRRVSMSLVSWPLNCALRVVREAGVRRVPGLGLGKTAWQMAAELVCISALRSGEIWSRSFSTKPSAL